MSKAVTRIPPSPTGRLHIGTARTALFNFLFAKRMEGRVVFRSEDTDRARSKKEFEDEIMEGLHWLGITWDEFAGRQSEKGARYRQMLEKIIAEGHAYVSKEPAKDDPSREVELVRLKNPGREVVFDDVVRGPINMHTGELGDFVIARSLDDALYHFAVVVDDYDEEVTHVIRGEDHISNTARQILIQEAIGAPRPVYAHLPLILDEKRAKLSKRSGATSVMDYRDEGILPEALVNYLALLGWNPGDDREDYSLPELIDSFTLEGIQKSGAAWDREKLLSVNHRWMRKLSDADYLSQGGLEAPDEKKLHVLVPLLKERARTFGEAKAMLLGEFACFFEAPKISPETLLAKEPKDGRKVAKTALLGLLEAINALPEGVSIEAIKQALMPLADAEEAKGKGGRGAALWPLRYALSGAERSPDPFTLIFILGKEESASRVTKAIAILGE